ncbi:MAG: hypothetical protein Q9227_007714 [Pyrenula ochraceoflavens]
MPDSVKSAAHAKGIKSTLLEGATYGGPQRPSKRRKLVETEAEVSGVEDGDRHSKVRKERRQLNMMPLSSSDESGTSDHEQGLSQEVQSNGANITVVDSIEGDREPSSGSPELPIDPALLSFDKSHNDSLLQDANVAETVAGNPNGVVHSGPVNAPVEDRPQNADVDEAATEGLDLSLDRPELELYKSLCRHQKNQQDKNPHADKRQIMSQMVSLRYMRYGRKQRPMMFLPYPTVAARFNSHQGGDIVIYDKDAYEQRQRRRVAGRNIYGPELGRPVGESAGILTMEQYPELDIDDMRECCNGTPWLSQWMPKLCPDLFTCKYGVYAVSIPMIIWEMNQKWGVDITYHQISAAIKKVRDDYMDLNSGKANEDQIGHRVMWPRKQKSRERQRAAALMAGKGKSNSLWHVQGARWGTESVAGDVEEQDSINDWEVTEYWYQGGNVNSDLTTQQLDGEDNDSDSDLDELAGATDFRDSGVYTSVEQDNGNGSQDRDLDYINNNANANYHRRSVLGGDLSVSPTPTSDEDNDDPSLPPQTRVRLLQQKVLQALTAPIPKNITAASTRKGRRRRPTKRIMADLEGQSAEVQVSLLKGEVERLRGGGDCEQAVLDWIVGCACRE